jgi:hypothetical protein
MLESQASEERRDVGSWRNHLRGFEPFLADDTPYIGEERRPDGAPDACAPKEICSEPYASLFLEGNMANWNLMVSAQLLLWSLLVTQTH